MVQSSCSRRKPHLEDEESDLFKEAQEFIKNKLNNIDLDPIKNKLTNIDIDRSLVQNLSGIAYACGIASKEQCVQQQRQAEEEGYNFIDEGIKVDWKMDPVKSMSDWILVVHDGSKKQLYHIHQFVVTTGDRKSGLLKKYINKSTNETTNEQATESDGITEVVCNQHIALFVPMMLDYIYKGMLRLNSECAAPLRSLANQFEIKALKSKVSTYIKENLNRSTAPLYLQQAHLSKDKDLMVLAMQHVIKNFDSLLGETLHLIPPELFQQVISNHSLDCPSADRLSQMIAFYIRGNVEQINDETFFFLTHCQVIPTICPSEAMWYLYFGSLHFKDVMLDTSMGGYNGSLKYRCMIALSRNWSDFLVGPVRKEVCLREENADDSGTRSTREKTLFRVDFNENMGFNYYNSLSIDIRLELLELALVEVSNGNQSPSSPVRRCYSNQTRS